MGAEGDAMGKWIDAGGGYDAAAFGSSATLGG